MSVRVPIVLASVLFLATGCSSASKGSAGGQGPGLHWQVPGFTVAPGQEIYQCFTVVQETGATGASPRGALSFSYTAESDVVHHMVIFSSDAGEADGYSHQCNSVFSANWNFRYAGGKDTNALVLPAGAAVPLKSTETWVIQLHYLNASTAPVVDHTKVDIEFTAAGASFQNASVALLGNANFSVPATGQPYEVAGTCDIPSGFPTVHIFGLWPHMHQIGTHFRIDLTHAGVTTTPIDESWSFGTQTLWLYPAAQEMDFGAGDSMKTTCTFVNNTGSDVPFGESSTQEMCFNFVYYYPAPSQQTTLCGL